MPRTRQASPAHPAPSSASPFDPVEAAIQDIADGKMVIVTDDAQRENEGDLIMAGARATPEAVNLMIKYGSGIICVPMLSAQLSRLGIHPMVAENRESQRTDFAVTVDAAEGITTGISAFDRWRTIQILADPQARPEQLVQPGHVFPLRAKPGGVLQRAGHTEAAVDLAQLAGLPPVGVICELMNPDGSVARLPQLRKFKEKLGLRMISIAGLIEYRHRRDRLVERVGSEPFASEFGQFTLHLYRSVLDGRQHYALTAGELGPALTLVRVHSQNILSDTFLGRDLGSVQALQAALRRIGAEGHGVVLYVSQPHGGVRLADDPQQPGFHVTAAKMDFRDYGIGAQILVDLGLKKIRLLTGTPRNVVALDGYGLEILEQIKVP